jgi:hypothetical protein
LGEASRRGQVKYTHDKLFIHLPNIAAWTESYGWIEIGQDDDSQSFVRALDMGGMVWEGKPKYKTVDVALDDLEAALEKIIEEIG